jgi:hypothetical protein
VRSIEETSGFNVATAGLGVALHLLHALSSSKPLLESGQTTMLATRDKPKTDPSYFEPHDFLVSLLTSIKDQIDAFLGGFHEIIPKDLIAIVSCLVSVFMEGSSRV